MVDVRIGNLWIPGDSHMSRVYGDANEGKSFCNKKMYLFILSYLSLWLLKESYFSDALLREIVDRMGKDLSDAADSYIDPMPLNEMPSARLSLMSRAGNKVLEAEQMDYDSLLDGNPNPALRDQEFAQHSSLWGHHFVSGGHGEGGDSMPAGFGRMPQIKTDASLPAYCNPPNPCPVGFTEEQGCLMDFENTAGFSRDYQAAQECMCDGEHMFDCQQESKRQLVNSDLEQYLAQKFGSTEHKNLVAKKFQPNKVSIVCLH